MQALTTQELIRAKDALRQAETLIALVRGLFIIGGHVPGARRLNATVGCIGEEVRSIERELTKRPA